MNHLAQTRPRDRLARCVLAFAPRSALESRRAGWVPTGAPQFPRSGGVVLDGTADCLEKNIGDILAALDPVSFQIRFVPDGAYDENATRTIFASTNLHYVLRKYNNASSNLLQLKLGNTVIANIGSGAYGAYWNPGEQNVLTIAGTSGDTDAWLNDGHILVSDSSAWSPSSEPTLLIGARTGPTDYMNGTIVALRIYDGLLVESDHRLEWRRAA